MRSAQPSGPTSRVIINETRRVIGAAKSQWLS
jgi:hypothetical protein